MDAALMLSGKRQALGESQCCFPGRFRVGCLEELSDFKLIEPCFPGLTFNEHGPLKKIRVF